MAVSDDVATSALRTVRSPRPRRDNRLVPRVPVEQRTHLRAILVAADAAAIGLAWTLTLVPWPYSGRPELVSFGVAAALTLVGVWILHLNGLYLARNATMRTMEMARIGRSVLILGTVAWAGSRLLHIPIGSGHLNGEVTVGTLATLAFLLVSRSTYRAVVSHAR